MTYQDLLNTAQTRHLTVVGGFRPQPQDNAPEGCQTLIMLGPDEPHFWKAFTQCPEYNDGQPHPLDRWSKRMVGELATAFDCPALFPSDGPPYPPFFSWALRTGRCHASPIQMLVHDTAGLFVSFRGVLALNHIVELPDAPPNPCLGCATRPCETSCPVGALPTPEGYDVPRCKSFLEAKAGSACLMTGCAVRRACPVSQSYDRIPAQSAFHMKAFLAL